jgi:5-methyltetrahydrofolate--homocysteine methyltransferase
MMVATAQDLRTAGVSCPVLVGGAALTGRFTRLKIAPEYEGLVAYAKDAMTGLDLANQVVDEERRERLAAELARESEKLEAEVRAASGRGGETVLRKAAVCRDHDIPTPPDLKLHVVRDYDLDAVFRHINPVMLYTRHLGFRGRFEEALEKGDAKAIQLRDQVRQVEDLMIQSADIRASAVYKFFRAAAEGDSIHLYSPDGSEIIETFQFGRQAGQEGLCLADYVLPWDAGRADYLCLLATTIGPGVRELAERWKNEGQYLRSHILQVLALEGAEAFAELLHQKIREMWGIPDAPGTTLKDLFKVRYRGVRVSFGYPACPRLEDQEKLFRLLDVERQIGVHLTEGYMMDPEGSVSALVFHHPEAKYFNLSAEDSAELERAIAAAS